MSTPTSPSDIAAARTGIVERLALAAKAGGREPEAVRLVAISKKQPEDRIDSMLATGQRIFGENRVQEAQTRWTSRRTRYQDLELRLVGPLQTNKAADAVALFDVIETLDRPKLAHALSGAIEKTGRTPRLYVQVNTGEEPQKAGIAPAELPDLLALCQETCKLKIEGLMCIPPIEEPASLHFALLARLANLHGLKGLSMGMSADYELAARLGATSVRVGSALFGARPTPN